MKVRFFCFTVIFLLIPTQYFVSAQAQNPVVKIFDRDGLSFSYPANWELADQSTPQMQQLKLTLANTSALIYVNSPRNTITTEEQLINARESVTATFIENINKKFAVESALLPVKKEEACSEFKITKRSGTIITGSYLKQPSTAEIYSTFPEHRFINLVFIRNDKDNANAIAAWQMIGKTVKTITPNTENLPVFLPNGITTDSGGVLNGRAISLPRPEFPPNALGLRISGSVNVRVVIDENGKVTEYRAISGHPIFWDAAQRAARAARFSPTYFCGERVKVTGNIVYNFVR